MSPRIRRSCGIFRRRSGELSPSHMRRSNPPLSTTWIASRSLSSGGAAPVMGRAFARPVGADPLARDDGEIIRPA
jgi:hypothetical protein